ncbi:unnamed protein product [Leuciscus chuanchicus]
MNKSYDMRAVFPECQQSGIKPPSLRFSPQSSSEFTPPRQSCEVMKWETYSAYGVLDETLHFPVITATVRSCLRTHTPTCTPYTSLCADDGQGLEP